MVTKDYRLLFVVKWLEWELSVRLTLILVTSAQKLGGASGNYK